MNKKEAFLTMLFLSFFPISILFKPFFGSIFDEEKQKPKVTVSCGEVVVIFEFFS